MERQRKRAELVKAKRVIQALSECNHAVIHIEDEAELLRAICRIVVDVGGYMMAWVGYAEDDRERTVRPVAQYGYEKEYLETVNITWRDAERGRGPVGVCIRTGVPSIIRSVGGQAEAAPWRVEALERGYASVIGLPLFLDGRRLGALCIYSSETDAFDSEEVEFLVKLSGNLSYGIGVLRLRKAQIQAEESLKQANLDLERRVEKRTAELVKVNAELRKEVEERRRTEEALKEGERKFRAIFDQTFQLMGLLTVDGRLLEANRTALQFSGVKESDVIGKLFWETPWWRHSTELQEMLRAAVKKAALGEVVRFETAHFTSYGSLHCMDFSLKPVMDEAGGIVFLIAEARDINKRKRAEEALRASEQQLADIIDFLPDATFAIDSEGIVIAWNRAIEEMTGVPKESMIGKGNLEYSLPFYGERRPLLIDLLFAGEEEIRRRYGPISRTGDAIVAEAFVPRTYGGKGAYLWGISKPLYDKSRKVIGAIESIRDITERQRAEEAMRESERRLRRAEVVARFGNWEFILGCDKVKASEGAKIIYGLEGSEWPMSEVQMIPLPQYRGMLDRALDELIQEGKPYNVEFEIRRPTDGKIVDIHSIAEYSPGNEVVFGVIQDITERKLAEDALRESEERFFRFFRASPVGASITRLSDGQYADVNDAHLGLFGYAREEVVGRSPLDLGIWANPEDRVKMLEDTAGAMQDTGL